MRSHDLLVQKYSILIRQNRHLTGFPSELSLGGKMVVQLRLSNDDNNENGTEAGLDQQSNSFARAWRFFFYISLPFLHDHEVRLPNLRFCGRRKHNTTIF